MSETTSTPSPAPEHPTAGGSYVRDPETGALTLQHRTAAIAEAPESSDEQTEE